MMTKRETKKILLWGDSGMTMNTKGELIRTMRIRTVYYLWAIPVWKTTRYVDGTKDELEKQK